MLACNETITLVHHEADQDDDRYTSTIIHGASWYWKTKTELQDRGLVAAKEVKVRIPVSNLPEDVALIEGDYLVRGELNVKTTKPADLQAYAHFKIMVIGDNRRGGMPHWVVSGS